MPGDGKSYHRLQDNFKIIFSQKTLVELGMTNKIKSQNQPK